MAKIHAEPDFGCITPNPRLFSRHENWILFGQTHFYALCFRPKGVRVGSRLAFSPCNIFGISVSLGWFFFAFGQVFGGRLHRTPRLIVK